MGTLLLLACSKAKLKVEQIEAHRLYTGNLFKAGYSYGVKMGYDILILSAKYGFIKPGRIIAPYDERFSEVYTGSWPDGKGYYVGGPLYFGNAPRRFEPLVKDERGIGGMVSQLQMMIRGYGVKERVIDWNKEREIEQSILRNNIPMIYTDPVNNQTAINLDEAVAIDELIGHSYTVPRIRWWLKYFPFINHVEVLTALGYHRTTVKAQTYRWGRGLNSSGKREMEQKEYDCI